MMHTASGSWDDSIRAKMMHKLELKYTSFEHIRCVHFIMEKRLLRCYTKTGRESKPVSYFFHVRDF